MGWMTHSFPDSYGSRYALAENYETNPRPARRRSPCALAKITKRTQAPGHSGMLAPVYGIPGTGLADLHPFGAQASLARGDHGGIHPQRVQTSEETGVLDFHAPVHHYFEARRGRFFGGFFVNHAQLHPHDLCSDRDRFIDNRRHRCWFAENVHDFYAAGNRGYRRVAFLAQNFVLARIHGITS